MNDIHFIGGPLDGQTLPERQLNEAGQYADVGSGAVYYRVAGNGFFYSHQVAPIPEAVGMAITGPRPEVTVRGDKLMTLGDLARFVDQARAAGYSDDHVPSVVNSFGGRIRSLTVKSRRRAVE